MTGGGGQAWKGDAGGVLGGGSLKRRKRAEEVYKGEKVREEKDNKCCASNWWAFWCTKNCVGVGMPVWAVQVQNTRKWGNKTRLVL